MPYIKQEDRDQLTRGDRLPMNAGELNYTISMICTAYFHSNGGRYQQINDIVGALEGAKLEFYQKVAENGDLDCGYAPGPVGGAILE